MPFNGAITAYISSAAVRRKPDWFRKVTEESLFGAQTTGACGHIIEAQTLVHEVRTVAHSAMGGTCTCPRQPACQSRTNTARSSADRRDSTARLASERRPVRGAAASESSLPPE